MIDFAHCQQIGCSVQESKRQPSVILSGFVSVNDVSQNTVACL